MNARRSDERFIFVCGCITVLCFIAFVLTVVQAEGCLKPVYIFGILLCKGLP